MADLTTAGTRRFPGTCRLRSRRCSPSPASCSTTPGATPTSSPTSSASRTDGRPWAELWLGTHPAGAATLADGRPLREVTGELPYLLKVLAAGQPLSLQTHPTREQAVAGFAAGRYPDPEPKPELLCALTPFTAYCGVRPVAATIALLDELGADELGTVLAEHGPGAALAGALPRPRAQRSRRARRGDQRPTGGALGDGAGRSATPAIRASPPRCCSTSSSCSPARRSSSAPGTSTPTSPAPASS